MRPQYLDSIRSFEGYTARAGHDYKQWSNGFGTRARHPGEVIDRAEAESRFRTEIDAARRAVTRFAPMLDEGSAAALTSLTFNAGTAWMSSGLGAAIKAGDLDQARAIFTTYVHAGGEKLAGLVQRRTVEAQWFANGVAEASGLDPAEPIARAMTSDLVEGPSPQPEPATATTMRADPPTDRSNRPAAGPDDGAARFMALLAGLRVLALFAHSSALDRGDATGSALFSGDRRRSARATTSV